MRVNDLQIGDWVYCSKGSQYPMQVVAIFKDGDLYLDFEGNEGDVWECKADDVEPIPITESIFYKQDGFESYGNEYYCENNGRRIYFGFKGFLGYNCKVENVLMKIEINFYNLKWIHQIQQAIRLCGIDKEIKL